MPEEPPAFQYGDLARKEGFGPRRLEGARLPVQRRKLTPHPNQGTIRRLICETRNKRRGHHQAPPAQFMRERGTTMRRFGTLAIALGITILLAGCGGRTVDEELLPTRVPTFGPADFAVTLAATPAPPPTATPLPATPTSLPVVELATAEPEATEVLTPTVEVTARRADETVTPAAEPHAYGGGHSHRRA